MSSEPTKIPGMIRMPYTNATAKAKPAGGQIGLALLGGDARNVPM